MVQKSKRDFEQDDNWKTTFERDTEELIEDQQNHNVEVDEYDDARGRLLPNKLPAELNLMVYDELWSVITNETLREHWAKGGKYKCVKFGNPSFEPSFWLGEIWPWREVYKHPRNLEKTVYTGPGLMTEFLKKVIQNI